MANILYGYVPVCLVSNLFWLLVFVCVRVRIQGVEWDGCTSLSKQQTIRFKCHVYSYRKLNVYVVISTLNNNRISVCAFRCLMPTHIGISSQRGSPGPAPGHLGHASSSAGARSRMWQPVRANSHSAPPPGCQPFSDTSSPKLHTKQHNSPPKCCIKTEFHSSLSSIALI